MRFSHAAWAAFFAFLILPSAVAAANQQQFDVFCRGMAHRVTRPYRIARASPWDGSGKPYLSEFHYVVDLATRQFCAPITCINHGPVKLKNIEDDRVYFEDKPGMHQSFGLRRNDYIVISDEIDGSVWETRGTCRRAPFSGWRWRMLGIGKFVPAP